MLFVEPRFFLFFLIVGGLYWSLRSNRARKLVLLAASYYFYAAWDWRFLSLILISTVTDYVVALALTTAPQSRRRLLLLASLVVNLGLLGVFKYADFFAGSLAELLGSLGIPVSHTTLSLTLPVGISFYTFQTLSYTIDVYRGRLAARKDVLDVALFVAFFPQLVAGPIVRAAEFLPQLDTPRRLEDVRVRACLALFLAGFLKKAVVADNVAPFVDALFAAPAEFGALALLTGVTLYAVQIYCDFSGYSDMAIAVGGLLGYRLPVNFRWPYLAANIADFWRRWHISLSTWLRDYLYIPLGGNRGGRLFTLRNLMITMLLGGLWHGAAWNFVVWGGMHGLALAAYREWSRRPGGEQPRTSSGDIQHRLMHAAGVAITLSWVLLSWVFFRAPDFPGAIAYLGGIFAGNAGGASVPAWTVAAAPVLFALHVLDGRRGLVERFAAWPPLPFAAAYGFAAALAVASVPLGYRPFIYFQF